jgi:hypothetical protein
MYYAYIQATEAALLLAKLAEESGKSGANPLRAKKLHVLAAFEVERHRKKVIEASFKGNCRYTFLIVINDCAHMYRCLYTVQFIQRMYLNVAPY